MREQLSLDLPSEPTRASGEGALREALAPGAVVLRGLVLQREQPLLQALRGVIDAAPFRHLTTPGGQPMSVAMTNCGEVGWTSDRNGYRYTASDPTSGHAWPAMPAILLALSQEAAELAGFPAFAPDACLINRYAPGTRLSLHQDKDEQDLSAPIVSVSLGLPAVFLLGGLSRGEPTERVPLWHGDVMVFGGPARLRYHGVLPIKDGRHLRTGRCRLNLTFRKTR